MSPLGWTHTAAAVAALAAGAMVFFTQKGTRRHRQLGWAYVVCMLVLNGTALLIYRLFGRFGPFHVFALVSLAGIGAGTTAAIVARRARQRVNGARRLRAVDHHYNWMAWSYIGLAAAAVSEVATRVPALRPRPGQGLEFGLAVAIATLLVAGVGAHLVRKRHAAVLGPFRHEAARASRVNAIATDAAAGREL